MKRKICIITGTRAEYGLLKPLIDEIYNDKDLQLQIIATGMHLSPEFGLTFKQIEKDGFPIDEKIEILLSSDSTVSVSKSIGLALIGFSEAYQRLKPDINVILGDRFEAFGAAAASLVCSIPIAHIHGGENTEGAIDEAFRHSITKMSHLHFTAAEEYRKRVIQLGEQPKRVYNVGSLGLDNIKKLTLLQLKELEKELNLKFKKYNLLVTFHPVTLEDNTTKEQFQNILAVLDGLQETLIIFTMSNADPGGRTINNMIDEYVDKNIRKSVSFNSMGQLLYLSTMRYVDAIIGNSSSGIIEAPSFKIGTINIGDRQKGRLRASSIIDCSPTVEAIRYGLKKLYSKEFQQRLRTVSNPYGEGNTAIAIKETLKNYDLLDIVKKRFYDISINI